MTEEETEDHIAKQNAEIKRLRADVNGLRAVVARDSARLKQTIDFVNHESNSVTRHIAKLYDKSGWHSRHLVDIYKYLWPLIERVLPKVTKDMGRFHALVREHNETKKP